MRPLKATGEAETSVLLLAKKIIGASLIGDSQLFVVGGFEYLGPGSFIKIFVRMESLTGRNPFLWNWLTDFLFFFNISSGVSSK